MKLSNILNIKSKDETSVSFPQKKIVHGIEIRKLPCGAYIHALDTIKNLPEILLKECFPEQNINDVLEQFKTINEDSILTLAGKLLNAVPEHALQLIAALIDVPFEKIRDELSPKELLDVLKEFWKLNDMSNFLKDLKGMVTGSKILSK